MMFFLCLLVLCVMCTHGLKEGDSCVKEGVPGVCTNIRTCSAAQDDIRNRIRPQHCELGGVDFIVCCVSSVTTTTTIKPASSPVKAQCHLPPHPSVEYRCLISNGGLIGGRPCKEYEPLGTVVSPTCRTKYHSPISYRVMRCIDGLWDHVALCNPECGTVTPDKPFMFANKSVTRGRVPWHVGIYKTRTGTETYTHICGGSVIGNRLVISAAHCFWSDIEGRLPASNFGVAVGKVSQPWDAAVDRDQVQQTDVREVHLPLRFQGSDTYFQDDIAIVVARVAFVFNNLVRPVCLHFDYGFEAKQLQPGHKGKVSGWSRTSDNGSTSKKQQPNLLKVIEVPYISVEICRSESPFRKYITSDKICTIVNDDSTELCSYNGGGWVFPEVENHIERYYLRGVMSTRGGNENACKTKSYVEFTQVLKYELMIEHFWNHGAYPYF